MAVIENFQLLTLSVSFNNAMLVFNFVTLLSCVWAPTEELICVASEVYASGGWYIGEESTILSSFEISFSS